MVYASILGEAPLFIANVIAFICMILLLIAKHLWQEKDPGALDVLTGV